MRDVSPDVKSHRGLDYSPVGCMLTICQILKGVSVGEAEDERIAMIEGLQFDPPLVGGHREPTEEEA